jgi:hypothetical protein
MPFIDDPLSYHFGIAAGEGLPSEWWWEMGW